MGEMTAQVHFMPMLVSGYYVIMSVILLAVMGWDKFAAVHSMRRVPEKRLWLIGGLGGALGGLLAMQLFHHKTRKPMFWVLFLSAVLAHGAFWGWVLIR